MLARRAYLAAVALGAVALVVARRDELADLISGARLLPLLGALALLGLSLVQSAWFWSSALGAMGSPTPVGDVLETTVRALPARYLPGGVWYAVGRVADLARRGVPPMALGATAALETVLSFVVAVGLGTATAALAGVGTDDRAWLVPLGAVLAVVASPPALNAAVAALSRRRGHEAPSLGWAPWAALTGQIVVFWLASALAFAIYLEAFPAAEVASLPETVAVFLLAWAAGFVAVLAPQGAGVFEVAVAGLLAGEPFGGLALVVGGYRALTAVRDVLAVAALGAMRARRR